MSEERRTRRKPGARSQQEEARRSVRPRIAYPSLPITGYREEIAGLIERHPAIVVCGETGSGKTTQLPKICLELGRGLAGMIGHTQPRRLAARSVAARLAEETGLPLGAGIGYQVRFDDRSMPETRVKLMTDGILLNELSFDPRLDRYDTIIVDEAHERSLNIDFLLGYLRRLLPKRPDLRLIITSATIDPQRFARHFDDAPVIEVEGRSYPVEIRFEAGEEESELAEQIAEQSRRLMAELGAGDILVFLPGEREIRAAAEILERTGLASRRALASSAGNAWEILPLYGRLSETAQGRVFRPGRRRRIVLATNVAETSLTVPRVAAVVDSGLARISRYSYRSKFQHLQVEEISRASAAQRSGRCGRLGPGVCIRLYSKQNFQARPQFTDPEIKRTNLASVILQMSALGLGDIADFPFLDPPDMRFVRDGLRLLRELEAVDAAGRITGRGRAMSRLPVDPRLSRMLLGAAEAGELRDALLVVAGLAGQDPRRFPLDEAAKARTAQGEFENPQSDFLTLLNLWRTWQRLRRQATRREAERWCAERYLSPRLLREWGEIHSQLRGLCREAGMPVARARGDDRALHRALLAGLLSHIGRRDETSRYDGARGVSFYLHPSSALVGKPPSWLFAMEIVKTSRLFARMAAAIATDDILEVGSHLVQRSHEDPHWNSRRGRVEASETVSLFGLILAAGRRVDYGPVDADEARRIFIREALVRGRVRHREKFWRHNQGIIARIREREGETRRSWLAPEAEIAALYEKEIPADVVDIFGFRRWLRRERRRRPRILCFTEAELAQEGYDTPAAALPPEIELLGQQLPVSYRFRPGEPEDGATIGLPEAALEPLTVAMLDRSVPAFVADRAEWRMRAMPKSLRRRLQPIAKAVETFTTEFLSGRDDVTLEQALAEFLAREYGITLEDLADRGSQDPAHLRLRIEVTDEDGGVLRAGRDLQALRQRPTSRQRQSAAAADAVALATTWEFGDLPEEREERAGELELTRYPALADRGDGVCVVLQPDRDSAAEVHAGGVLRLLVLALPQQAKLLRQRVLRDRELQLAYSTVGSSEGLAEDFVSASFASAFARQRREMVRSEAAFASLLADGRTELIAAGEALAMLLKEILDAYRAAVTAATELPARFEGIGEEVRSQLAALVYPGFVQSTPAEWLECLPRYLRAAELRCRKLPASAERDGEGRLAIATCESRLAKLRDRQGDLDRSRRQLVDEFRWHTEELRVSLFAQELGTRGKVSPQRLEKLWLAIIGAGRR